jgi:glycosyltransferase involved in cell wall biosynthesis
MKPIKVAMILHSYYPIVGGAERQLQALLPHLRTYGVQAAVLTRRYPGLAAFELVDETPVYRLPAPGPKPFAAILFILSAFFRIWRMKPDIIHTYDLMSPTSAALLARRLLNIPVVAKVLSGGPRGDIDRIRHRPGGKARLRSIARQVDKFVVISQEIATELDAIGGTRDRYAFIPNGVDLDRYSPLSVAQKMEIRRAINLPPEARIVLFVGRLIPEKRPEHLLSIWDVVREQFPNAMLVMVGSGTESEKLQAMQVEGVHFTGQIDDPRAYLQTADLFVLPSAREGLSNALLEAQASGVPAIVTSIGAAPELIEDGVNGMLMAVDDLPALKESVLRMLGNADLRRQFAATGRERVSQKYSLQSTAEQLTNLYRHILGAGEP